MALPAGWTITGIQVSQDPVSFRLVVHSPDFQKAHPDTEAPTIEGSWGRRVVVWPEDNRPYFRWEFQPASVDTTPLARAVGEAIGQGSTCWSELRGAGVFQSERAAQVARDLTAWIEQHYQPRLVTTKTKEGTDAEATG